MVPKAASLDRVGTCHRSIGGTGDGGAGGETQVLGSKGAGGVEGMLPAFPALQGSSPCPLQPLTPPWCAGGRTQEGGKRDIFCASDTGPS